MLCRNVRDYYYLLFHPLPAGQGLRISLKHESSCNHVQISNCQARPILRLYLKIIQALMCKTSYFCLMAPSLDLCNPMLMLLVRNASAKQDQTMEPSALPQLSCLQQAMLPATVHTEEFPIRSLTTHMSSAVLITDRPHTDINASLSCGIIKCPQPGCR